ncbi:MAG: hypothetical protein ABMB14_36440, partial [Myxococcota bacterium]
MTRPWLVALAATAGCRMVVEFGDPAAVVDPTLTGSETGTGPTGPTGDSADTGGPGTTPLGERGSIVGDAPGDAIGAPLIVAPDLGGDGIPDLVVGVASISELAVFSAAAIGPDTPYGTATVRFQGSGSFGGIAALVEVGGAPAIAAGVP